MLIIFRLFAKQRNVKCAWKPRIYQNLSRHSQQHFCPSLTPSVSSSHSAYGGQSGGDIYIMKISENLFFHFYLKSSLQSSTIIPSKLTHGIYGVVTDSKSLIRNLLVLNWQGRHTGLHGMKTRSSQIYRSGWNIVDMIFICLTWMMPPFQSCKVFRYFPLYSVRLWRIETAIKLWKYLP